MFKASHKLLITSLILGFIILVAWELLLQGQSDKTTFWNYQFNSGVAVFYFAAFAIAFWRMRKYSTNQSERRALRYFGLTGLFWGLGFVVWVYYNLVLKRTIPFPSIADVFFAPAYPLLGYALWHLRQAYNTRINDKAVRDSIIIVVISAIVILVFLNRPDLSPDLGLSKNILNVIYSLGDIMLVAVALIELRSGQARKYKGLYLLVLFLLFQASGDFLFAYHNNADPSQYWNGDISDLLFGASGFMLAYMLAQNKLLKSTK